MNTVIEKELRANERIIAKASGRPEVSSLRGQVVLPFLGHFLATNERVLVFTRQNDKELTLDASIPYEKISDVKFYRDIFAGTFAATKTLHLQDSSGELYRMTAVADEDGEGFEKTVQAMIASRT